MTELLTALYFYAHHASMNYRLAVVTGASSGIGLAFARALAQRKSDLVLCARRKKRLNELADELAQKYDVNVHVVVADLSLPSGVDDLVRACENLDQPVELLVNNAGFGSYGRFDSLDLSRELNMVDLNVRSVVALTGSLLPGMLERNRGAIINIASTTSFQPVPYMATYGATKAFVLSFSEAIAYECASSDVRILAVCPGHTPTEFQSLSGVDQRPTRTSAQSAEQVVDEALQALENPRQTMVVTGWPNKVTTLLPRFVPRAWFAKVVERAFRPRS